MVEIFYSNGFFGEVPVRHSVIWFINAGFDNIELSSGIVQKEDLKFLKKIKASGRKIRLHNYFPSFDSKFVMNLASSNKDTREQTRNLIFNALEWSIELGSDYYAFHSGFLFDPEPTELRGNLQSHELSCYFEAKNRFKEQLLIISDRAQELGVNIAVENNVYDFMNYQRYKDMVPFLGVCEHNIHELLIGGVGLLLDFGHLKVSATTLSEDYYRICKIWLPHATGFHLSDNNGLSDDNKSFDESAWFIEFIEDQRNNITIEVNERDPKILRNLGSIVQNALVK